MVLVGLSNEVVKRHTVITREVNATPALSHNKRHPLEHQMHKVCIIWSLTSGCLTSATSLLGIST